MSFTITDADFDVLEYIRNQQTSHIEVLKLKFGCDVVKNVQRLYESGLICTPLADKSYYSATTIGQTFTKPERYKRTAKCAAYKSLKNFLKPTFWDLFSIIITFVFTIKK